MDLFIYSISSFILGFGIAYFIFSKSNKRSTNEIKEVPQLVEKSDEKSSPPSRQNQDKHQNQNIKQLENIYNFDRFRTRSVKFKEILKATEIISLSQASILIQGESGTGKELLAKCIHENSPRADKPFIAIHIAAIAENLIESELFGHEKGAFTGAHQEKVGKFEIAEGGTIFLDEVGEIPLSTQVKLLRVIQERYIERIGSNQKIPIDIRIITATNRNLSEEIHNKNFREDLYYRLNVIHLNMIPLRERKEDIALLLEELLQMHAKKNQKEVQSYDSNFLSELQKYNFPGNIRELSNIIERAVIFSQGTQLDINCLKLNSQMNFTQKEKIQVLSAQKLDGFKKQFDYDLILKAYQENDGNKAKAARSLNLKESTYRYHLKKALQHKSLQNEDSA